MVAFVDGVPRTVNLRDAIDGYVRHQIEVFTRRSNFRLDKARRREHILQGRVQALDVIDEIIALIRGSEDAAAAKAGLMDKPYEFSEAQAVDILDMQLRQMTWLSRIVIEKELDDLRVSIAELESILVDDKELVVVMSEAQYVKAVPASSFETRGRGGRAVSGGKLKRDDIIRHAISTTARTQLPRILEEYVE